MDSLLTPDSAMLFSMLDPTAFDTPTLTPATKEKGDVFSQAFTRYNHNQTASNNDLKSTNSGLDLKERAQANEITPPTSIGSSTSHPSSEKLAFPDFMAETPSTRASEADSSWIFDGIFEDENATLLQPEQSQQPDDHLLFQRAIDARFNAAREYVHHSKRQRTEHPNRTTSTLIDPNLAERQLPISNFEPQEASLFAPSSTQNLAASIPNAQYSNTPAISAEPPSQVSLLESQTHAQTQAQSVAPSMASTSGLQRTGEEISKPKRRRNRKRKQISESEKEEKHIAFLERNRIAAGKCRNRKKGWVQQLEDDARTNERRNLELKMQMCELMDEVQMLTGLVKKMQSAEIDGLGHTCYHLDAHVDGKSDGDNIMTGAADKNTALLVEPLAD